MPPVHKSKPASNGAPSEEEVAHISEELRHLAVPIDSIKPDPHNARLHPKVNLDGIKESFHRFGQMEALKVNKRTGIVMAGNGRLSAAKKLGWRWIAVIWKDWDDTTTSDYALADNTTSDTAQWDMEAKARLIRLIEQSGNKPICMSDAEIMELRTLEFTPPPTDHSEEDEEGEVLGDTSLSESNQQKLAESMVVERAVELCRKLEGNEAISRSQAIYIICQQYLEGHQETTEEVSSDTSEDERNSSQTSANDQDGWGMDP